MANHRQAREHYFIQSVDNALHVLEILSESGQEVHVTRLSQQLGLNKSTVFRLLATFKRRGYIEQDQGSHHYRLGLSAFETSQKLLSRMEILDKARPIMAQLLRQHNETVYLAVRRKEEILFLDMFETTQQVKTVSFLGQRFPLAKSAAGKLFLALQGPGDRLPEAGTLPSPDEAARIRRLGYCLDREEYAQGISALAAPIFDAHSRLTAALVLLGPDFRIGPERAREELAAPLLNAAGTISFRLGFQVRAKSARRA